jgi:hypothetical protein
MKVAPLLAATLGGALLAAMTAPAASKARPLYWTGASLRAVPIPVRFVPSPPSLLQQCHRAARAVGYPVPCPMTIPRGLQPTPVLAGPCLDYRFQIVGAACTATPAWRRWVAGSSQTGAGRAAFQHLVIQASPTATNYAHAVNGPIALRPNDRPMTGGIVPLHSWRMRWLFVDPTHNDGSAFMSHVVLCWTVNGHTYAIGFHAVTSETTAAAMDYQLVRHVVLVRP